MTASPNQTPGSSWLWGQNHHLLLIRIERHSVLEEPPRLPDSEGQLTVTRRRNFHIPAAIRPFQQSSTGPLDSARDTVSAARHSLKDSVLGQPSLQAEI